MVVTVLEKNNMSIDGVGFGVLALGLRSNRK